MSSIVYLNGNFIERSAAKIAIDDGGWLHGAGLFETMYAENHRVFRLSDHLDRLRRSASILLHDIDLNQLPTDDDFRSLLWKSELTRARLRLTVSTGSVFTSTDELAPFTVCVTASPLVQPAQSLYEKGATVCITRYRQSPSDPLAGHKTTAFLGRLLGMREARGANCFDALWFTPKNYLAEGSVSNVFIVKNGVVKTPPLATPVLPGVARATVLSLASTLETKHEECALSIDDLLDAEEVFLTNVIMQVMPVCRVEKRAIGRGHVGPVTLAIMSAYRAFVERECATP